MSAFASWLAMRGVSPIELAPGAATPRSFGNACDEHLATRRAGGLFDFSFMGCSAIQGPGARAFVNALQTRRLDSLPPGRIAYTLLLRDDGSVLNDATVWRIDRDLFWVFTGRRDDHRIIAQCASRFDVETAARSDVQAVIAVQGDISRAVIEQCLPAAKLDALPYFGFRPARFPNARCWIARLGYSGESGYELVIDETLAAALWQALLARGAAMGLVECGFDAIDSLRIEAGHILFTRELASPVTPFELGLQRLVDFEGRDFRGGDALRSGHARNAQRRLVGLLPSCDAECDLAVPQCLGERRAVMTSVCRSPLFERQLGLGLVRAQDARPGTRVELASGVRAEVARLPFYDPMKILPRR